MPQGRNMIFYKSRVVCCEYPEKRSIKKNIMTIYIFLTAITYGVVYYVLFGS